jgi:hypothetical protein
MKRLPISDLRLPPMREAILLSLPVIPYVVLVGPFHISDLGVMERAGRGLVYFAATFLGLLTVRATFGATALGRRLPSDPTKQVVQIALRLTAAGLCAGFLAQLTAPAGFSVRGVLMHLAAAWILGLFGWTAVLIAAGASVTRDTRQAYVSSPQARDRVPVSRGRLLFVESRGNYLRIVSRGPHGQMQERYVRSTLYRAAEELSALGVVQCHRSYLVNPAAAADVVGPRRQSKVRFVGLDPGAAYVPVSRDRVPAVRDTVRGTPPA